MGICKRAQVRGIQHAMLGAGMVTYSSAKIAEEVADAIADNLSDEELPEVTDDSGLTAEEAADVMDQIVEVANEIAEKTGFDQSSDDTLIKAAASIDLQTMAHTTAVSLMEKAAGETDVTGDGQHHEQYADGGMAEQDIIANPSSEVMVPQGTTQLDTSAGTIGAEEPQTETPGYSPPISNEVSKLSSILQKLSMEGDVATGDGTPGATVSNLPGRTDLPTNIGMPKQVVERPQGTTQQEPNVPVPVVANPAAKDVTQESKPQTDVQNDVGKIAASILRHPQKDIILAKLAEEMAADEAKEDKPKEEKEEEEAKAKEEEKAEEAKEDESKKEAALFGILNRIASTY